MITVIILLILAGVAMSLITGEGGLFARANHAGYRYNEVSYNEAVRYNELDALMGQYIGEENEKSDLEKLREYFALGWDAIEEYDEVTGDYLGYKNVAPILDASTSIEEFGFNGIFNGITYNGKKYAVEGTYRWVYECVADLNSVDLDTFGAYVDENLNVMLVTPSTPDDSTHTNFAIWNSEDVNRGFRVELEGVESDDFVYVVIPSINGNPLDEALFYDANTGQLLGEWQGDSGDQPVL